MPSHSQVAARVMFTVRPRATRPQQTILLLMMIISSSTTVTVTVTANTMITAQTPATRHVPRGPQISCHAVNSPGLIG